MSDHKRANIKRRLLQYVADLWGYQQVEMDSFDPLIDLLLGACAVEFERTGNQIVSSQSRIMEKLAQLLLPESLTIPQPAHMVIHAQPVEAVYTVKDEDQFSFDKEIVNPAKPTEINKKPIFFSPTIPIKLYNASIKFVAMGNKLVEQASYLVRENKAVTKRGNVLPNQAFWLGIKIDPELGNIPKLSFFFDWKNHPEKQKFFNLLPVSIFSVHDHLLEINSGYDESIEGQLSQSRNSLMQEWDVLPKIEDKVNKLYQHHFITLKSSKISIKEQLSFYPGDFEKVFEADDLKKLKEPLLWLKIELSQLIPQQAMEEMVCAINCFPACNRQLMDNRRPYRLEETLNIIPLKEEDFFLSVQRVRSGNGESYQAVPFFNIHQMEAGTYAIRKSRVGKFDSRNAHEMLQYVLELMRDEGAAFAALGGVVGSKDIVELEQNLNKIENNLARKFTNQDINQYLMLKPGRSADVFISYWSTAGSLGNFIPSGSALKTRAIDFKSNSVVSATNSFGGKDKPSEQEKLYSFRSSLLSRDRMVTKEDIKSACFAELGETIKHVEVKKGYKNDPSSKHGLCRTLDVLITPSQEQDLSAEEWLKICNELSQSLEQRSSLFLPIRVSVTQEINV